MYIVDMIRAVAANITHTFISTDLTCLKGVASSSASGWKVNWNEPHILSLDQTLKY